MYMGVMSQEELFIYRWICICTYTYTCIASMYIHMYGILHLPFDNSLFVCVHLSRCIPQHAKGYTRMRALRMETALLE